MRSHQHKNYFYLLLFSFLFVHSSCTRQPKPSGQVSIQESADIESLNPCNFSDANAGYVMRNIFQNLLYLDPKTLELIPWAAVSRPEITARKDKKGLLVTYVIRPEAGFDNGEPVTGKDIEFYIKVVKNPLVDCARERAVFEIVEDLILYPTEPKKITFVLKDVYILAEALTGGDVYILPSAVYDPKGIMKNFSIPQLCGNTDSLSKDPRLIEFAADFNSEKFQRDTAFVKGSGAYSLTEWVPGQKVVLTRKKDWWGDRVENKNILFEANMQKITYVVINDQTSALVALKAGQIDVMANIKSKDFVALRQSPDAVNKINLYSPISYNYAFLGINTSLPKFTDQKVRQALSHLVDEPKIIHNIFYDLAERVVGPVNPSKTNAYNREIKYYEYDPAKASSLLSEAGWKDSNGDGTLDNLIGGKRVEMTIDFLVNTPNEERKSVALLFQEEARKVGIKVNINLRERAVYLDDLKNHRFEMCYGAWVSSPFKDDFRQVFQSTSANGGSNYVFFGNASSDALIDSMRIEMDEDKYNEMCKRFQVILHEEVPYIFLHTPKEKFAISKRFTNAEPSVFKPGYWEAAFIETKP